MRTQRGLNTLQVSNPQVINGQQTTRVLASSIKEAAKGAVLVRVIRVPRDKPSDRAYAYDELLSEIVAGTNRQTAITASDLQSNDRRQIELERELRKRGYLYLRKRQTKGEARSGGGKQYQMLKKEELAQAVAGCDLDPIIIRSGRERLFEEDRYTSVFPNSDPNFYLPRYWLLREVTYRAKGVPARGYAKWMVLNFMWWEISSLLRKRRVLEAFIKACENDKVLAPLHRVIDMAYLEALRYYRQNRGTGETQLDISTFFKNRKDLHKLFPKHWKGTTEKHQKRFETLLQRIRAELLDLAG